METVDLYRYFDATRQAEFLFERMEETVNTTLPEEVGYLIKYDLLHDFLKNHIDMPARWLTCLSGFWGKTTENFQKGPSPGIQPADQPWDPGH